MLGMPGVRPLAGGHGACLATTECRSEVCTLDFESRILFFWLTLRMRTNVLPMCARTLLLVYMALRRQFVERIGVPRHSVKRNCFKC